MVSPKYGLNNAGKRLHPCLRPHVVKVSFWPPLIPLSVNIMICEYIWYASHNKLYDSIILTFMPIIFIICRFYYYFHLVLMSLLCSYWVLLASAPELCGTWPTVTCQQLQRLVLHARWSTCTFCRYCSFFFEWDFSQ